MLVYALRHMALTGTRTRFGRIAQKIEFKLLLFFGYVATLIYTWIKTGNLLLILLTHLIFVLIFGIIYLGYEFLMFFVAPAFAILWPIENYRVKRLLKSFKQGVPVEAVVILGHSNWFTLEGWVKPIFLTRDVKSLIKYLTETKQDFSFYPNAKFEDVEKIMSNQNVKRVYFFGHGDSHRFQLGTDEILYYCDFNNPKYGKEFVHQIHCGDPYGKSLIDYVVPEANMAKCFMFRKPINSCDIVRELKRMTKAEKV